MEEDNWLLINSCMHLTRVSYCAILLSSHKLARGSETLNIALQRILAGQRTWQMLEIFNERVHFPPH